MSARVSSLYPCSRIQRSGLSQIILVICGLVFLVVAGVAASAKDMPKDCGITGLDFDAATDVHTFKEYRAAIDQLLQHDKFKELDCLADTARSEKSRFSGGTWKLRIIYAGLSDQTSHPTDIDWKNRIHRLEHWQRARPGSVTAPIALAEAYKNYAWYARGDGFGDTVSESGWKLFHERLKKAEEILEQDPSLQEKCPQWYVVMLVIARGEGWDLPRTEALVRQAIALEPTYDGIYRGYATYLLPQWYGEDGDSARFAQDSADRLGGVDGDILYFQLAEEFTCSCDSPQLARMSWPRIQKGFDEIEKKYGPSFANINYYALMAVSHDDEALADSLFKQIGDNWDEDVWQTEDYFKQRRDIAAWAGPAMAHGQAALHAAEANLQTPDGAAYMKQFQVKFAAFLEECRTIGVSEQTKSVFMVEVTKDGSIQDALSMPPTNAAACLFAELRRVHEQKQTPFPPPPSPGYWLKFDMGPQTYSMVSK